MRPATLLLVALLPTPSVAWQSACVEAGATCDAGPHAARVVWGDESILPLEISEHQLHALDGAIFGNLPNLAFEDRSLWIWTGSDSLAISGSEPWTLIPEDWTTASRRRERRVKVTSFAELPDFSFSLLDWVTGNETCPLDGVPAGTTPEQCHSFELHMSPVNSTHFLPQAQAMHAHYHQLARQRMVACLDLDTALSSAWTNHLSATLDCGDDGLCPGAKGYPGADAGELDGRNDFVQQCELEALMLEAVGQHYLQDAWSSGHMWHRWGGPTLTSVGGTGVGLAVGMMAGIIHGAKAVFPYYLPVDDPMCAPHPDVNYLEVDPGPATTYPMVGDLYRFDLIGDAAYDHQEDTMRACMATSFYEVYSAGPQESGAAYPPSTWLSPSDPRCFSQRATNEAMWAGLGISVGRFVSIIDGDDFKDPTSIKALLYVLSVMKLVNDRTGPIGDPLTLAEATRLRLDMVRIGAKMFLADLFDADGTGVATNTGTFAIGPLLGVQPNEQHLADIPPATADPALPWTDADTEPLLRAFHRAHADHWCDNIDRADLDTLKGRCTDTSLDDDTRDAACTACTELGQWFHRDGCPGQYDTDREPLCDALVDRPDADFLYLATEDWETPLKAVQDWCTTEEITGRPCVTAGAPDYSQEEVECYCTGGFVCYNCQYCNPGEIELVAVANDPEGEDLTTTWELLDYSGDPYALAATVIPDSADPSRALFTGVFPPMTCLGNYTVDGNVMVEVCDPGGQCGRDFVYPTAGCSSELKSYGCGL